MISKEMSPIIREAVEKNDWDTIAENYPWYRGAVIIGFTTAIISRNITLIRLFSEIALKLHDGRKYPFMYNAITHGGFKLSKYVFKFGFKITRTCLYQVVSPNKCYGCPDLRFIDWVFQNVDVYTDVISRFDMYWADGLTRSHMICREYVQGFPDDRTFNTMRRTLTTSSFWHKLPNELIYEICLYLYVTNEYVEDHFSEEAWTRHAYNG